MKRRTLAFACGALFAVALVPSFALPARAEEPSASASTEPQGNVRVTIRLGKLEQGKPVVVKHYDLVVAAGSVGSKLLSGARIPIPTGNAEDAAAFVYQNIGFSIAAKAWLVGDKKIKLLAEIEDSRLEERGPGQNPTVETRQLSVNAVLGDGVPMEVTRIEAGTDPSGFVEIEAKILR